jgi:hypothetical protein
MKPTQMTSKSMANAGELLREEIASKAGSIKPQDFRSSSPNSRPGRQSVEQKKEAMNHFEQELSKAHRLKTSLSRAILSSLLLSSEMIQLSDKLAKLLAEPAQLRKMSEINLRVAAGYIEGTLSARRREFYEHLRRGTENWLSQARGRGANRPTAKAH